MPTFVAMNEIMSEWGRTFSMKDEDSIKECSVCQVEFKKGEAIIELNCRKNHIFHDGCVEKWVKASKSCQICKTGKPEVV